MRPPIEKKVKMRQVAVELSYRGQGLGTELVKYAEEYCRKNDYRVIVLHARKTALNFYERLGYKKAGFEFIEVGIPHYKMKKEV